MARPTRVPRIVYGRAAYEGFAKAIGSRLGLNVRIDDGNHACINFGGVIEMPGMQTYQTAEEFNVTCGTIVHELGHQFYESHLQIDPARARLEHDCLNAVLDVADETWLAAWFNRAGNGRPGELLDGSNEAAFHRNGRYPDGPFRDWTNPDTHAWKVLCVGILAARGVRRLSNWKRFTASEAAKLGVDAKACFRLLAKGRLGSKQSPSPTFKRFAKLIRLAKELAELLKPFAPPESAAVLPLPGGIGVEVALAIGESSVPAGAVTATEQQGADLSDGPVAASSVKGGSTGGRGDGGSDPVTRFDAGAFERLSPAVRRVAERIATDGDGLLHDDGLSSGPVLGQAHRLVTDGQCLARWQPSDHADGMSVCVLLDCSGSMEWCLSECAGIARAFAVGMRSAGAVQSLAFGDDVEESDDFAAVRDLGGTATHLALEKAVRWLGPRSGQRWIVLVTDGGPENPAATQAVCDRAVAQGIHVLAVGLRCGIRMRGTACVTAADPTRLAIELDAAGHLIESR